MSLAFDCDLADIDPEALLVLLYLCNVAQPKDPIAYPSKASIAARTRVRERKVFDMLQELVGTKLITPVAYARGGKGRAVHYYLELGNMLIPR